VGNAKTLTITGNAVLGDGAADTVTGLTTLSVSGTTLIRTTEVSSSGSQTYTGALTLGESTSLSATGASAVITAAATVDSDAVGTPRALTISASGTNAKVALEAAVGGAKPLSSLAVTAEGIDLNAGAVTSVGGQTYTGAVTLGADTTLTGVGITLASTVKSDGTNRSLTINDSGTTTLGGAVGSATAGDKLSSLTTDTGGTTAINGGSVATVGNQTYGDAVTLGADAALSATANNAVITMATTVNSATATPRALTVTASGTGGNVVLGGTVGATDALSSLAVTDSDIDLTGSTITTTASTTAAPPQSPPPPPPPPPQPPHRSPL
jgi:hypothetical protein